MDDTPTKPTKAIYAAVVAFLTGLGVPLVGDADLSAITMGQWVAIVLATVVAAGGTYGLTNKPKDD